jgi:2-C-methyl-D-erythritol 2,4-cyclodiphosphate synthase
MARLRVGVGYDVHPFAEGRRLRLGGIEVRWPRGLAGHSDGDVALHALADAVLGACAGGDIGEHFPDHDPAYAGADSRGLLAAAVNLARRAGYRVVNADLTVVAEAPKLGPYRQAMQQTIAAALNVAPQQVSVKATTSEGLGFVGRGEGIAALAVVLLEADEGEG